MHIYLDTILFPFLHRSRSNVYNLVFTFLSSELLVLNIFGELSPKWNQNVAD